MYRIYKIFIKYEIKSVNLMRKLKKIESIKNKKPWLANTVLLLLLPLSRQSQAKIDRQRNRR